MRPRSPPARRPSRARCARRLAPLLLVAGAVAGCELGGSAGPRPTAVVPDRGSLAVPVTIRIRGQGFGARVTADFSDPAVNAVDAGYQASLGSVALQDVALRPDGDLVATVPAGLASGAYDLTVVDPWGHTGTLPGAYRVLVPTDGAAFVTGYRVDAVGAQQALRPFLATISAIDASGAVVPQFNGSVRLSDTTGSVVPGTAARFVAGRWTGLVEVRAPARADVLTVTGDQGATGASAPFGVAPAPAARARFSTPAASTVAGRCTGPITVALEDVFGAAATAERDTPLATTAPAAAGLTVYSDGACATPAAAVVAAGQSAATFWFAATRAGAFDLTAAAAGVTPAVQRETVAAGPASLLAFVTPPQTVNAGACSQVATVEVRDAWGNPAPGGARTLTLDVAPAGALTFSSTSACSGATSTVALAAGATRADLWFSGASASPATVTVAGAGLTAATQDELVTVQGSASRLVFLTPPRAAAAGDCSEEVSIGAEDSLGNPVASAGAVQVSLSASPAAGFTTYSDAACTVPATTVQIGAGQSAGGFRFRGTLAASVAVAVASPTLTGASQTETVRPAPPARVVFTSAAQRAPAGSCSAAVKLAVQDASGNASPVGAPLAVALSAAPAAGLTLHADASCTTAVTAVTIPGGASEGTFWFKGTRVGPTVLSAAPSGLAGDTQGEEIVSGVPARLAFTSAAQTTAAGACSGAATVELRDGLGNPAAVAAGAAVSLSASPPAGFSFFRDAACSAPVPSVSVPPGGSGATFFFSGTAPGTVTVTATAPGLDPDAQGETVTAARPQQLAFATPAQVIAAGTCSAALTVESRDPYGNPSPVPGTADTPIALAASPAAHVTFFAGAGCGGSPVSSVSIAAGGSAATFSLLANDAGALTVTASSALLGAAAQVENVTPLAPDRIVFATPARTQRTGTCSAAVTLRAEDAHGNASPVVTATAIDLTASPAAGFAFYSDAACTTPAASVTIVAGGTTATTWFQGATAGAVTVTAAPRTMPAVSQVETLVSTSPDHLVFASAAQTVAAGTCSAPVDLLAVDAAGGASPVDVATAVALSAAPSSGVSFFAGAGCLGGPISSITIDARTTGATFSFRASGAGAVTLTAAATGLSPSPTQAETITAPAAAHLVFTTAAQTVTAGACSAATRVQAVDASGAASPVASRTAVALSASPAGGVTFYAGAGCSGAAVDAVAVDAGQSAATFSFRATSSGTVTLTASAPGLSPDATQAERIEPGAPDHLAFASAAQSVAAGECSSGVVVQASDAAGNASPVAATTRVALSASPAAGVSLFAGTGCSGVAAVAVYVGAGTSSATFSFRATASGPVTITASAAGMSPDAAQVETVGAAAADRLAFTSAPQSVEAGKCSAAVTVEARDATDNPTALRAAASVSLGASPSGGVSFFAGAGCSGAPVSSISIAAGASAATLSFQATASGTVTLKASADGFARGATQDETVTPGGLDHFTWGAIASPQAADVAFPVAVTARDAYGNVAASFGGTAALSASAGTATCVSSCTSASATGGFLSGVWTGSLSVTPKGTGVTLTAASGAARGTSAAFDLSGPATRSPPTARLTVRPAVIISGNDVSLDASASSDYQTPADQLSVSWDTGATAASMSGGEAPTSSPWSSWFTGKAGTGSYVNNGSAPIVFHPRVAVRDRETGTGGPDVAYASATVIVLPNGNGNCTVDTSSDVDDGASSCYAKGGDGKLSLREAIRIANGAAWTVAIDFSGPMTIAASGTLTVSRPVYIVGRPGVTLDTGTLSIAASGVMIAGLELSRQGSPVVIERGADVTLRDVYQHDGAGILVKGRARLDRVRLAGCSGTCVEVNDSGAYLALFGSELRGSGANTGLALTSCAGAAWSAGTPASPFQGYNGAVLVAGTVFTGFGTAVRSSCAAAVLTNDTFAGNGTGVEGIGASLLDSIFSRQTVAAVSAASCPGFATSRRHVVWQNASDGCLAAELSATPGRDVTFSADPLFVHPASGDYRIQVGSPARDAGAGTNAFELDGPGPGRYLGADADRGGRETY